MSSRLSCSGHGAMCRIMCCVSLIVFCFTSASYITYETYSLVCVSIIARVPCSTQYTIRTVSYIVSNVTYHAECRV